MTQSTSNTITWLRAHWLELLLAFALLAMITVSPTSLRAEDSDLPSGEQIFDDYLKATGGNKVRKKLVNRVTVTSLDLVAQGIKLNMTIYSDRPNLNYTVVESEFTGKIEKGTDGETVDDRPAYKLLLTPVEGKQQTMYFDTKSKLLLKHEFVIENPMGSIPITSHVSDYRKVDGVLLPFKVKAVVMDQERLLVTESVEHNVDLPTDRFDLPPAIQALVGE